MPFKCEKCQDTGIIDTGNNDLPCDCAAGDRAEFNCCVPGGLAVKTGNQLKREFRKERLRNSLHQLVDDLLGDD